MTGKELKELRKRLGLTQMAMAKALGISFMSYNTWEQREELSRLGNLIIEKFLREQGERLKQLPQESEKGKEVN